VLDLSGFWATRTTVGLGHHLPNEVRGRIRFILSSLFGPSTSFPFIFEFFCPPAELDCSVYPRGFGLGVRKLWRLNDSTVF
jgi:hypothetical protein